MTKYVIAFYNALVWILAIGISIMIIRNYPTFAGGIIGYWVGWGLHSVLKSK